MYTTNVRRAGNDRQARNPFLVWLVWPLINFGIYHLYWWYKINDEARRLDPSIKRRPVMSLLALVPARPDHRPRVRHASTERATASGRCSAAAGMTPNVIPIVGLVPGLRLLLSTRLYYQVSLNGIWSNSGNQPENTPVADSDPDARRVTAASALPQAGLQSRMHGP